VVKHVHLGLRSRLGMDARVFLDLLQDLTGPILLVIDDVPVDSDTSMVTSSISRICRLSLSEVLIGVRLHACL
jgi:hypothetical protein